MRMNIMTSLPDHIVDHHVTVQEAGGVFSILVEILVVAVNALPIVVVVKWKNVRTRSCTDDLIVMISVFDMISMILPSPIVHASYFSRRWIGGLMTCGFYQILTNWLRMCSLFALTMLSVDKSFSTHLFVAEKRHSVRTGRFKIILFTFTVVLLCLMVSSLPIIGLGPDLHNEVLCVLWTVAKPKSRKEYVFVICLVSFGLCNIICIGISNIYLLFKRREIKKLMYGRNSYQSQVNVRMQLDGTSYLQGGKLVSAMSVVVYITWLPTMILIVLKTVGVNVSDISVLYSMLSTSLSGLLNPVIYGLCDSTYRRGYKRVFHALRTFCHCAGHRRDSIPSVVLDSSVRRSASDTAELSRAGVNSVPRSTSGVSSTSGVLNTAFAGLNDTIEDDTSSIHNSSNSMGDSNLVQELKRSASERTHLLGDSHLDGETSSMFDGEGHDREHEDSSSSMLSSGDSYEDLRSEPSSDDDEDDEDDIRESAM